MNVVADAQVMLSDVAEQLRCTPHFGALATLLTPERPISRLDYVHRHCELLLNVKQQVNRLGLGSAGGFGGGCGANWALLRQWTGLATCQGWAALLNAGHLFGTFATERALLFHLDREPDDRESFISSCVSFDRPLGNRLGNVVERAVHDAHLYTFHQIIALWRLRDGGVSALQGDDRMRARLLLKAFLDPPSEAVRRWKDVFRRTRKLAYLALHHSAFTKAYIAESPTDRDTILSLFPSDAFLDEDRSSKSGWRVFDAIARRDSLLYFGSPAAAAQVLEHVQSFKPWWAAQDRLGLSFAERLDRLFGAPPDWPEAHVARYRSFVSLTLPSRLDWLTEARLWLRDESQQDPWADANFLVTPDPSDSTLGVDLYEGASPLTIRATRHSALQLARHYTGHHSDGDNRLLWISGARFMARAFQPCLRPDLRLQLQPAKGTDGHVGYASIGESYESARGLVKSFLGGCEDSGRENELRQLLTVADHLRRWRSPTMIMLARAVITEESGREITDIDGLCGIFGADSLEWIAMEFKKDTVGGGSRQLSEMLSSCVVSPTGPVQYLRSRGHEAWWATITRRDQAEPIVPSNSEVL